MTVQTLPDALRAEISDMASAKEWIRQLWAAGLGYHFDDGADDCLSAVLSPEDCATVNDKVGDLYELEWGPRPGLGYWYCPLGYLGVAMGFEAANQAEGFPTGCTETTRRAGLVLLDGEHRAGYEYGAPGRFLVMTEAGAEVGAYDTPEEAEAANPALGTFYRDHAAKVAAIRDPDSIVAQMTDADRAGWAEVGERLDLLDDHAAMAAAVAKGA